MLHPLLYLMGSRRIFAERERAAELCELCRRKGFVYRGLGFSEREVYFDCSLGTAKRLRGEAERQGFSVRLGESRGLPSLLWKSRYRYGLFLGILFCLFLFVWSERTLFSIRVEGNERVSDEEIIGALADCGLSVGDSLRGIDTSLLENRLLIASEDIAWISINLRGNVAHVAVREREAPSKAEESAASNLVASRGGVIQWLEEARGQIVVEAGDAVGKGDLLVSGIWGKEDGPLRMTHASGRVMARTERQFRVSIPLSYEKKEYTGEIRVEKYLIFFEKEIKFFTNSRNFLISCDTIERVEYFEIREDSVLPVGIRTVEYAEYREVTATRSPETAEELAYYQLRMQIESEVPDGMLVQKSIRTELTDGEFILICDAEFIEDIAEERIIETVD